MKLFTSLVALLSLASLVVPSSTADQRLSSCKASDRVLVSTRNVTAAGHEFQVSTKACSADVLNSRAIEKRQVFDVCNNGETQNFECVAGGVGPTFTDCDNLSAAIEAAFEQPGASYPSSSLWPTMSIGVAIFKPYDISIPIRHSTSSTCSTSPPTMSS
ncbi:hypothetical protein B0H11DRAFT_1939315 [Mycena galericulata]|nr:hypothetical protein B0H11DRAFT_1939315 [Mycena galericulata]